MKAVMPGRSHQARADLRNCYLNDEEDAAAEEACSIYGQVEADHNLPALIWWVVVALFSVGSFFGGLMLGSDQ